MLRNSVIISMMPGCRSDRQRVHPEEWIGKAQLDEAQCFITDHHRPVTCSGTGTVRQTELCKSIIEVEG